MSLDALRGFDMLFIMGFASLVVAVCGLWPSAVTDAAAASMSHVAWDGFAHHDTIFPLFLFIAGVSFPYSVAKQRAGGMSEGRIYAKIVRRGLTLVVLGMVYNGLFKLDFENLRIASVLGRIGLAWSIAAVLYLNFGVKTRAAIAVAVLAGYGALSALVAAPDAAGAGPLTFASTSSDDTMEAITAIRSIAGKQCFVSGMSAMVTDLKDLCEKEEPIYVGIAVALACVAMMIFMDNWITPFVFLMSIGMAILLNMGTNYFLGEISYLTKALSAVLQLAVTMDYSIFLWHSYEEQKSMYEDNKEAMAVAINNTLTSVVGSSITTVAGFIALCFMSYTLGLDLGIVMAKGVILGVIGCVTTLPSMILVLDKLLQKTSHKSLLPDMGKVASAPSSSVVGTPFALL